MDNTVSGIGPIKTYNAYLLETKGVEETSGGNEANSSGSTTSSQGSEANSADKTDAQKKLDDYKTQVTSIYNSSITSSDSFPANIQSLITKMKTSYCNSDIITLDVEKSKKQINSILKEFYENVGNMTAANCVKAINKMTKAIQYTMSHTDNWLKAKLINDESGNQVSSDEYGKKRKQFKEFFTETLNKFNNAVTCISEGCYKDPKTMNSDNASDVNKIPTDYSDTLELIKSALKSAAPKDCEDPAAYAEDILNFKDGDIAKNFKKIKDKIDRLLTDSYVQLLNGTNSDNNEALTKRIRELNYLMQLYNLPTNVSTAQTEAMIASIKTFNSAPTDDNYYDVSKSVVTVEKENIDYQDVIRDDLEKMFEALSKAIGDGDDHTAYDTEYDGTGIKLEDGTTYNSGLSQDPSTPGSEARDKLRADILSIKNRGELEDVELATLLQRELKAIQSAQELELKKYEEEYMGSSDDEATGDVSEKSTLTQLYKALKDKEEEYKSALESYNNYFYSQTGTISGSVSGGWSGETSGSLSGSIQGEIPIEDNIDYDILKQQYQIEIDIIKQYIEKKEKQHEYEVSRMKQVFDAETRDIVETLSKLGVVTGINLNL